MKEKLKVSWATIPARKKNMNTTEEKVKEQLNNLWNWCGSNKPESFMESDGKQWINLPVPSSASRLKMSDEQYLTALRNLRDAGEVDIKKVSPSKLMYSMSSEAPVQSTQPTVQPKPLSIEDKWSAYFESMSPENRWNLWNITINNEWNVCSEEAKDYFKNDIQKYFTYRHSHPVADIIKQRVYQQIQNGRISNVYAPSIVMSSEEARKQAVKGWSKIQTTGVSFKSLFSIENDDNPPDPF